MKTLNSFNAFGSVLVCMCLACVDSSTSAAQENSALALKQDPAWSCISAKQKSELVFYDFGKAEKPRNAPTFDWQLTLGNRVLGRGRTDLEKINQRDAIIVRLNLSEVELRSIVEAELRLSVGAETKLTKKIFLFPADPFANQQRFLMEAKIHLFDPDGDTETVFESANIPFQSIQRLQSIDSVNDALIMIGEGVVPGQHAGLSDSLSTALERGNNVIWLAADEGEIEFKLKNQFRVVLENDMVIKRFDSRFDIVSWAGKSSNAMRWEPSQSDDRLSLKTSNSGVAWPWIELHCGSNHKDNHAAAETGEPAKRTNTKLVLCGLGIVEHWDDGPVAKYLLLELVKNCLSKSQSKITKQLKPSKNRIGEVR